MRGRICGGGLAGDRVRTQFWARELGKRACAHAQCKGDAKPGRCGAVQGRRGMAAVEQRRRSAGVRVLAAGVATAYRNQHKEDQGGNVVLTEGLKWRMLQCRMAGVEIRRRRSTELVGEVVAGRLRASDPHERVLRRDAKPGRWSARLGVHQRRGNFTAEWRPGRRRRGGTGEGRRRTGERPGGVVVKGGRVKASRPLIRVLVINDNGLWINDFI